MNTETNLGEYTDAWKRHIGSLDRLRWNLPKKADQEKLDRLQEELMGLVTTCVKDLIERRHNRETMEAFA